MKTKNPALFIIDNQTISLRILIEKEIERINSFLNNDLTNTDALIHEVRKAVKAIQAVLLLYRSTFNHAIYLIWKSYFKDILKEYASLREAFVNLQTLNRLENELKGFGSVDFTEVRNELERKIELLSEVNQSGNKIKSQLRESIRKITSAADHFMIETDIEKLNKEHKKTFQKTQKLYHKLTLTSTSSEFHNFRKWARYFYFQQSILNRVGLKEINPKENKSLHKLTEHLGDVHDLELFYQYLNDYFKDVLEIIKPVFILKIKKSRKKILFQYAEIIT